MGTASTTSTGRSGGAEALDAAVEAVAARKEAWLRVSAAERAALLREVAESFGALADEWHRESLRAKGWEGDPYAAGWEWSSGPLAVLRDVRGLEASCSRTARGLRPLPDARVRVDRDGRTVVRVYPTTWYERLTTPGVSAEVWMPPSVTPERVWQRRGARPGTTALVLGAGNVTSLCVNDALAKLFGEDAVVVLKPSPQLPHLAALLRRGLGPLVEAGFLAVVDGGAAEGGRLCRHPAVDVIHVGGTVATYEKVVFGDGAEGRARKAARRPLIEKPVTAELGNVGPCIVVPGPWDDADVAYQAQHVVSHVCDQLSYSCSRTRLLVQHAGWPLRQRLVRSIASVLATIPAKRPPTPAAAELHARFLDAHPEAQRFGDERGGRLPWVLVAGVPPERREDVCFVEESFCPLLAETALDAASPAEFLDRAVEFVNERVWGTLTATILVHPRSLRDRSVAAALDRALRALRYGVVAVNVIPGLAYALCVLPWGSAPGNPPWNIQSGAGFGNNSFLLAAPEKSVIRGPFRAFPRPIWFPSRAQAFPVATRRVVEYERRPSAARLARLAWAALAG